jgi:hypothetical protein
MAERRVNWHVQLSARTTADRDSRVVRQLVGNFVEYRPLQRQALGERRPSLFSSRKVNPKSVTVSVTSNLMAHECRRKKKLIT